MRFSFTHSKTGKKCSVELRSHVWQGGLVHLSSPTLTAVKHKLDTYRIVGKNIFVLRGDECASDALKRVSQFIASTSPNVTFGSVRADLAALIRSGDRYVRATDAEKAEFTELRRKLAVHAEKIHDRQTAAAANRQKLLDVRKLKDLAAARALIAKHEALELAQLQQNVTRIVQP